MAKEIGQPHALFIGGQSLVVCGALLRYTGVRRNVAPDRILSFGRATATKRIHLAKVYGDVDYSVPSACERWT